MKLEKYIILPGKTHGTYSYSDLLVARDKTHHNKNWYQAREALHKDNAFMLTIRQYIDFIELLKTGKVYNGEGIKLDKRTKDKLLDEILAKRTSWRGEWLDAYFRQRKNGLYILTENKTKPEKLEQCLMEGCYIDINSINRQGMPTRKSNSKEVYYWYPRADRVAWFWAGSGGAYLCCDRNPQNLDSEIGVRVAHAKNSEISPPKEKEVFKNPFDVYIPID